MFDFHSRQSPEFKSEDRLVCDGPAGDTHSGIDVGTTVNEKGGKQSGCLMCCVEGGDEQRQQRERRQDPVNRPTHV